MVNISSKMFVRQWPGMGGALVEGRNKIIGSR